MSEELVVYDDNRVLFLGGPTIYMNEWAEFAQDLGEDGSTPHMALLPPNLKQNVKDVADWIKKNQKAFEAWVADNPETYNIIKGILKYIFVLGGIDWVLPD